ncbi:MGDG synthase family glycosyltransferase [Aminicella lysinilytica]|uniref:UDP-N-acetylglucosamine:LPS N-acetylglucosamine transferase n=1 Tax=Aminicella lysinilytica TaxID=433323 RepID=A0A4R6Q6J8_9FIRM|nr:glycosyltransferase [Aminicella lysinilytica]TDP58088.1 UDP-N-acetylglucosamine:LPS N-acetylglucosamine transferase [Aminicella lysinilytica]
MNIMILTARFGMGHYKVAEAIKEDIEKNDSDIKATIVDFMSFLLPKTSKLIYTCYDQLVFRNARLYNAIGNASNKVSGLPLKYIIALRISKLVKDNNADAIIVDFPLCSNYISAYKEMSGNSIPMYTCITDVPAHSDWIAEDTRLYFVSSEETEATLIEKGVDADIIRITGVPVRNEFKSDETTKKDIEEKRKLLVMGGGLGLLPGSDELLDRLSHMDDVRVTIVAGKNKELETKMADKYPGFRVLGYTEEISKLMKESDAVITKPGGVTMFEAINTGTPMYIVRPFLLQELGNARYIEKKHIGRVLWYEKDATADDIEAYINNAGDIEAMKDNMYTIVKKDEKCDIITEILSDMGKAELKCS